MSLDTNHQTSIFGLLVLVHQFENQRLGIRLLVHVRTRTALASGAFARGTGK